jgi:hypothetical protein
MFKNTAAIQAHIEVLLKNNLLQNEVYNVEFGSQKFTFEIDTILTMKCSTEKKKEKSNTGKMKYKNLRKSENIIRKRKNLNRNEDSKKHFKK